MLKQIVIYCTCITFCILVLDNNADSDSDDDDDDGPLVMSAALKKRLSQV